MNFRQRHLSLRRRRTGAPRAGLLLPVQYLLVLGILMSPILERFPRAEDLEFGSDERTADEICEPQTLAIEIDAAKNRLYLRCGEQLLLDAACSTGSGEVLRTEDMTWWFDTPRGSFRIESIARGPVWRKPDWAYLEEGEEIPSQESQRLVPGALGDFALMIREGLFIHGTLYERLLGESVTHGCIRLGSQDLAFLVENVEVGTPVFIY